MLDAAENAGRSLLVAQVLPYMGEFEFAYRAAQEGRFGRPLRAYFKRIISPPDWIPNFYNRSEVGGPLIDLHVHDTHFVRLLFGMPRRVMCSAELKNGLVKFCHTLMEFEAPGTIIGTSCGVSDQNARPFCHGYEIQFEKALLQFELAAHAGGADTIPLKILGQDGTATQPELAGGDEIAAFAAEIDDAVKSIESGIPESRLDGRIARDAIHICQCLQQSAESGNWVECV